MGAVGCKVYLFFDIENTATAKFNSKSVLSVTDSCCMTFARLRLHSLGFHTCEPQGARTFWNNFLPFCGPFHAIQDQGHHPLRSVVLEGFSLSLCLTHCLDSGRFLDAG